MSGETTTSGEQSGGRRFLKKGFSLAEAGDKSMDLDCMRGARSERREYWGKRATTPAPEEEASEAITTGNTLLSRREDRNGARREMVSNSLRTEGQILKEEEEADCMKAKTDEKTEKVERLTNMAHDHFPTNSANCKPVAEEEATKR